MTSTIATSFSIDSIVNEYRIYIGYLKEVQKVLQEQSITDAKERIEQITKDVFARFDNGSSINSLNISTGYSMDTIIEFYKKYTKYVNTHRKITCDISKNILLMQVESYYNYLQDLIVDGYDSVRAYGDEHNMKRHIESKMADICQDVNKFARGLKTLPATDIIHAEETIKVLQISYFEEIANRKPTVLYADVGL